MAAWFKKYKEVSFAWVTFVYLEIHSRYWLERCGIQERSGWREGWYIVTLSVVLEAKMIEEVPQEN